MAEPTEGEPIVLHFRGDGTARIPFVPMRDLTKADVDALPPDALREAMASPLYEAEKGAHLPITRGSVVTPEPETEQPTEDAPPGLPPIEPEMPPGLTGGDTGKGQKPAKSGG